MAFLACSCSARQGLLEKDPDVEDITSNPPTKSPKELNTAFIARSYSGVTSNHPLEIRPVEASITINQGDSHGLLDVDLHYDFKTGAEDSSCTFDLDLNNLEYDKTDDTIRFDVSERQGEIALDLLEEKLSFTDVSVKGKLYLVEDDPFAGLEVSGIVKGRPFYILVDSLSIERPEPKPRQAVVGYIYYEKFVIKNRTSASVSVNIIPFNKQAFEDISVTLPSGGSFEKLLPDYEAESQYRTITLSKSGSGNSYTVLNWTSPDAGLPLTIGKDFHIGYNENHGRIEPFYYPIITLEITDDTLSRLAGI